MDQYVAWFLLICPLAATIAILVRWHKAPEYAISASIGSSVLCFFIAVAVFCGGVPAPKSFMWIDLPGFQVDFSMILDPLAKGMLLVVTGVGMLVHIFSYGYMQHDPSKGRFFGGLSIFMFSMTGIVLSSNLIKSYGPLIRSLRKLTNNTLNAEPKWRHNRSELTTGYRR